MMQGQQNVKRHSILFISDPKMSSGLFRVGFLTNILSAFLFLLSHVASCPIKMSSGLFRLGFLTNILSAFLFLLSHVASCPIHLLILVPNKCSMYSKICEVPQYAIFSIFFLFAHSHVQIFFPANYNLTPLV